MNVTDYKRIYPKRYRMLVEKAARSMGKDVIKLMARHENMNVHTVWDIVVAAHKEAATIFDGR